LKCASVCTIAFLAGRQRWVTSDAKLGFHQGIFGGQAYGGEFREAYNAAGLSQAFIDHALSTPPRSMWLPTLDELMRAKVVTQVAPAGAFAVSGFGPEPTAASVIAALTAVPVIAALKRLDAEHWPEVEAAWVRDALLGQPVSDVMALVHARVSATVHRLRSTASDDVVIAVANLLLKEIPALQAKDPEACWSYLMTGEIELADYLSSDLVAQDLAVENRILLETPAAPAPPTSAAEGDRLLRIVLAIVKKDGADPTQLIAHLQPNAPHSLTCPAVYTLYRVAVTLPTSDAAALLRYLLQ
jgi:hypothetical protein